MESNKPDEKENSRTTEAVRFALAGIVCFLAELGFLYLLRDGAGMDTLIAVPIAFLISTGINYLICLKWVFRGEKDEGNAAKAAFLITSLIGLVLNEGLMLLFRALFGEDRILLTVFGYELKMYLANKCLATLLVMIWNYFTKRAILRGGAMRRLTGRKGERKG